ncbi:lysoplasmalogenase [Cognatishimia sp.]|uniref:lysoplasmalogenase n=1 Tax=Cognatishimia sp. TaxID=2211648 RepID=UPI003515FCC2|nr:lysoplasmalogenase [Cognatishimia sp.]
MTFLEEIAFRQSLFWGGVTFSLVTAALFAIFASWRGPSWWKTILKAMPAGALVFAAYANFANPLVIAALALSLVGDIALSRPGDRAFLVGLIGFAAAHLAYIVHFYGLANGTPPVTAAVILVALALSTEFWLKPHTKDLKWPVRIYVVLITLMGLTAAAMPARELATMGAFLFIFSDLLLAIHLFRLKDSSVLHVPIAITLWVAYALAQVAILIGAGFAQPLIAL